MAAYYWNSERLKKLEEACSEAESWSDVYFKMKDMGELIKVSSAKSIASRGGIPVPKMKRGGYRGKK